MKTLPSSRQSGFALFFALVFLLMMTLVAVTAMRGTALELSMANNVANYEVAFEAAESGRQAFVRPLPDMARCEFKWSQGIPISGGGGGSCVPGQCQTGGGGEVGASNVNFPIEPGASIDSHSNLYINNRPGELVDDPTTYVDEYKFVAGGITTDVAVFSLGAYRDSGGDASTGRGYEKPEDASSNYFEFVSRAERGGTIAQSATHYRLLNRDTKGDCLTDVTFGG